MTGYLPFKNIFCSAGIASLFLFLANTVTVFLCCL